MDTASQSQHAKPTVMSAICGESTKGVEKLRVESQGVKNVGMTTLREGRNAIIKRQVGSLYRRLYAPLWLAAEPQSAIMSTLDLSSFEVNSPLRRAIGSRTWKMLQALNPKMRRFAKNPN